MATKYRLHKSAIYPVELTMDPGDEYALIRNIALVLLPSRTVKVSHGFMSDSTNSTVIICKHIQVF